MYQMYQNRISNAVSLCELLNCNKNTSHDLLEPQTKREKQSDLANTAAHKINAILTPVSTRVGQQIQVEQQCS